jgi:multiple sugar transport system permease protein
MNRMDDSRDKQALLFTIISIIVGMIFLFPLYWMLVTSVKFEADIFKNPPSLFPQRFDFGAYLSQLASGDNNMFKAFYNSFVISTGTMVLSVFLSIPAAYGLARFKFKGKKIFILSFLVTQMLPAVFVLTPLFIMYNHLNLQNTYLAPILSDSTIAIPFSVLILRTYFLSIPKELDDAAKIDGCNHFTAFLRIMVPIAYPGVIVGAVFSFLFAWGDLVYGLTFINKQALRPVTAGIFNYIGQYGTSWNKLMAFGVISIAPVAVIFILLQKYIISGLTSGAVKG